MLCVSFDAQSAMSLRASVLRIACPGAAVLLLISTSLFRFQRLANLGFLHLLVYQFVPLLNFLFFFFCKLVSSYLEVAGNRCTVKGGPSWHLTHAMRRLLPSHKLMTVFHVVTSVHHHRQHFRVEGKRYVWFR
jgi:hypothetical protein